MKKFITFKGTLFVIATVSLCSCGNHTPDENAENAPKSVDSAVAPAVVPEQNISYSLPSPLQIAKIFKRSGLKYNQGLTNPESNLNKYSTNITQAINLGVYSADLSYCVLNKQNQPAIDYMKVIRQLANKLGMGSVFEMNNLGTRFEKNIGKEDSLASIIAELQMQTDLYLEDNEQEHISAIVFSGAWVESLYIGSKVYGKDKSNSKISKKISEQMTLLNSIIHVLRNYEKKDPNITGVINDLQPVIDTYNNFPAVKNGIAHPDSDSEVILSEEEVDTISTKIDELRTKYVNG